MSFRKVSSVIFVMLMLAVVLGALVRPGLRSYSMGDNPQGDDVIPALDYSVYMPFVIDLSPYPSSMAVETLVDLGKDSQLANRLVDLNTGVVRLSGRISWREMQPNEGEPLNWSLLADFEDELRLLKQLGIKPVVVLNDSPYWATVAPTSCAAVREDKFAAYATFIQQMVAHFKSDDFNVHDWELGNEPDVDPDLPNFPLDSVYGCWGDIDDPYYGGKHYGKMLKYVAPYIRQEDPLAKIWFGGLVLSAPETTDPNLGKPELFLKGVLEEGAEESFDIIGFHGHTQYYGAMIDAEAYLSGAWNAWGGGIVGKIKYLRDMLASYDVDKPLVINEVGVGCRPEYYDFCNPPIAKFYDYQADMLVRIATRVLSQNVNGFTWYTLEGPGWRFQGLLDELYNPQKAFTTYREMNRQLPVPVYLGTVDYGPGLEAYAFQRNGSKELHILWAKDNLALTLTIPVEQFVNARTRVGDRMELIDPGLPVDGNYELTVGFTPIFLTIAP
jgi:hypothetical protein